MDWRDFVVQVLNFIADLAGALAWPIVAVIALTILVRNFKEPVTELISRIRRISHNGTNIDIAQGPLREFTEEPPQGVQITEIDDRAQNAISNDPRAAVIEGWLRFEWEARRILENRGIVRPLRSPSQLIQALREQELLSGNLMPIVNDLRGIRNRAAHEMDINFDSDSARYYVEAVELAISILRSNADREH